MRSLALELLLHWRIQRNGLCICYPGGFPMEDGNKSRRECVQDETCAREDHAAHNHQEPWEENR